VQAVQAAAEAGRSLVAEGVESILRPRHLLHRAQQGMSVGAALAKVGLMGQDDDTAFKGDLGVAQRAAWSKAIDLVAVKRLGHAIDAKVNDVLLGAVAGALRHYLDRHGEPVEGASVRALIPVNLRSIESAFELGNRFGLVYLDLPVGEPDRLRRVLKVKRRMDEIKASSEAAVTFGVLQALGYCPIEMEAQAVRHFSSRASAVMTNVPGPQEELRMRGRRLQNIMPWVPRAGEIGLGVSVFSYDGEVRLGVACDAGLIPDPGAMLDGFEDEFDRLTDRLAPVAAGMEE
jgi:WS/DGAT/MGAT family acyltransferase